MGCPQGVRKPVASGQWTLAAGDNTLSACFRWYRVRAERDFRRPDCRGTSVTLGSQHKHGPNPADRRRIGGLPPRTRRRERSCGPPPQQNLISMSVSFIKRSPQRRVRPVSSAPSTNPVRGNLALESSAHHSADAEVVTRSRRCAITNMIRRTSRIPFTNGHGIE